MVIVPSNSAGLTTTNRWTPAALEQHHLVIVQQSAVHHARGEQRRRRDRQRQRTRDEQRDHAQELRQRQPQLRRLVNQSDDQKQPGESAQGQQEQTRTQFPKDHPVQGAADHWGLLRQYGERRGEGRVGAASRAALRHSGDPRFRRSSSPCSRTTIRVASPWPPGYPRSGSSGTYPNTRRAYAAPFAIHQLFAEHLCAGVSQSFEDRFRRFGQQRDRLGLYFSSPFSRTILIVNRFLLKYSVSRRGACCSTA